MSPLRTESANAAGAPARRKRIKAGLAGGPQYRSLRAIRISSRCGSMFSTRNCPPVTGSARASPAAKPPGTSLTMWAGNRLLNNSRQAG
ncbi:hypothetical protein LAUMK41_04211 [Mycobacterium attenuatum]|uniref:Uncharacterized protein n=1 Tax=Mycobacterium attenuatum TaxID=2341086 RepID=A0A498QAY8_9MYCO|nr:hypothetical protein LAUMK136_04095 [Mycobacterium attenuatum]VBA60810.1 hypothetical protein LAUMK41_04211 [Mycobacterium attenuatum]